MSDYYPTVLCAMMIGAGYLFVAVLAARWIFRVVRQEFPDLPLERGDFYLPMVFGLGWPIGVPAVWMTSDHKKPLCVYLFRLAVLIQKGNDV